MHAIMNRSKIESIDVRQAIVAANTLTIQSLSQLMLVYIQEGKGTVRYDAHAVPFKKGKLFVIPFDARYSFESEHSSLLIIECPQSFVAQIRMEADRIETCENINKLSYITNNYHTKMGCVFYSKEDGVFAEQLLKTIEREHVNNTQDYLITRQGVSILLNLIARNLIATDYEQPAESKKGKDIMKIITFIQKNIGDKQRLSIEVLANEFQIGKNYLGEYFKKHVGMSIQDYSIDYKLKLVEIRLKHSNMRLKEIAFELDFNDESHLSKLFKKYKNITPSQYRVLNR
jgi:AraC-like DNA-binding protein